MVYIQVKVYIATYKNTCTLNLDSYLLFQDQTNKEVSIKWSEIGSSDPVDPARYEIATNVMCQFFGPNKPGHARGYRIGVTSLKSPRLALI